MKRVTHFRGIPIKDTTGEHEVYDSYDTPEKAFDLLCRNHERHVKRLEEDSTYRINIGGGTHELLTKYLEAHPEEVPGSVSISALSLENRLLVRDLGDLAT